MDSICEYTACTGCMACMNACHGQAIAIKYDDEGFARPFVLHDKCVDCGLCQKVCPINNLPQKSVPQRVYSGWANNEKIRKMSSSGGAFSCLALPILRKGGVVFGAAMNDKFQVEHIWIEKEQDLHLLQGSKYVQSNIGESYKHVKEFLHKERKVLFCGTPCQVATLRNYLHRDYDNLVTVDLICHGIPSPKVFEDWKSWFKKQYGLKDFTQIGFRGKKSSWIFFHMTVDGHVEKGDAFHYEGGYYEDAYIRGFLRDYFLRPSCHKCRFTSIKRVSDFTIADWWGYKPLKGETRDFEQKGVSLILCNTRQGCSFFQKYGSSAMTLRERTTEEAMRTNMSLRKPFDASALRNDFWKDYQTMTFDQLVKKYMYPERLPLSSLLRIRYRNSLLRDCLVFCIRKSEGILRCLNIGVPKF